MVGGVGRLRGGSGVVGWERLSYQNRSLSLLARAAGKRGSGATTCGGVEATLWIGGALGRAVRGHIGQAEWVAKCRAAGSDALGPQRCGEKKVTLLGCKKHLHRVNEASRCKAWRNAIFSANTRDF